MAERDEFQKEFKTFPNYLNYLLPYFGVEIVGQSVRKKVFGNMLQKAETYVGHAG